MRKREVEGLKKLFKELFDKGLEDYRVIAIEGQVRENEKNIENLLDAMNKIGPALENIWSNPLFDLYRTKPYARK